MPACDWCGHPATHQQITYDPAGAPDHVEDACPAHTAAWLRRLAGAEYPGGTAVGVLTPLAAA